MKTNPSYLAILMALATLAFIAPVTTKAQTPSTSSSSDPQQSCPWQHHNHWCHKEYNAWAKLSEAERNQLKADMVKIHGNPKLVAARQVVENDLKTLRQTRRELLLQADPSIKPVLDKIDQAKGCHSQRHCGNHKWKE